MATKLVFHDVWQRLTACARGSRAWVAVAYLSTGARKMLPIKAGSVLVVDMSKRAVASGQTDPSEVLKFIRSGVEVHSAENLHAKVFVLGTRAFVGSANASQHSAGYLQEAMVECGDQKTVASCRAFVQGLRGEVVEPEYAKEMRKFYRPPHFSLHGRRAKGRRSSRVVSPTHRSLWLVPLNRGGWTEEEYRQEALAKPSAQRKLDRRFEKLEDFMHTGRAFIKRLADGDLVLQVISEENGAVLVTVPSHVIKVRNYRVGRTAKAIVFLGVQKGAKRKALKLLMKALGPHRRVLQYLGDEPELVRDVEVAHAVLAAWSPNLPRARRRLAS